MSKQDMHVEDAMDSKLAKTAVRIFVWLAPIVVGLFGWFITSQLGDIKREQAAAAANAVQTAKDTAAIKSDVRDLNTRFDLIAVQKLEALEKRVDRIEQVTKTP